MKRIDTRRVVADVADLQTFGDWTFEYQVRNPMRTEYFTFDRKVSVSILAFAGCPNPTSVRLLGNVSHEALDNFRGDKLRDVINGRFIVHIILSSLIVHRTGLNLPKIAFLVQPQAILSIR